VPKINKPHQPADFRQISITPILARILERMVVSNYIYPSLILPSPTLIFADQYAFRPTESTISAIISIMTHVTHMLAGNPHVIVIAIGFTKAFDTVRHTTLVDKLAMLQQPDNVCNWLCDFFTQQTHCTAYGREISSNLEIMASIVQGSAVGPAAYVVTAGDLQTMTPGNAVCKYADDTLSYQPAMSTPEKLNCTMSSHGRSPIICG
jgi:Reverse transcriptase (RNA-dependent DNA polymerase)